MAKKKTTKAKKRSRAKKKENKIVGYFKRVVFSAQGLPILLTMTTIAVLLVLFRMKGVEQDYAFNKQNKIKEKLLFEQKELQAKKAKSLSIKNLRKIAKKFNLRTPGQSQVIVIPANETK